jgi:hypothetical protein
VTTIPTQAIGAVIRLAVATAIVVGGCTTEASEVAMMGHVEGQVSFGPVSPVARPGIPNYRPKRAQLDVLDANDKIVAHTTSDDHGKFELDLAPGTYTIRPEPGQGHVRFTSPHVIVRSGETTKIGIIYDSGIR